MEKFFVCFDIKIKLKEYAFGYLVLYILTKFG